MSVSDGKRWFLPKESLDALIAALRQQQYAVIGPVIHDRAIRLEQVQRADQLARGVRDEQDGGQYRLLDGNEELLFEHVVGPDSAKKFFFPPKQELFSLHVQGEQFVIDKTGPAAPKLAILGLRPCDLAAIAVQDRVFGYHQPAGDEAPWASGFRCESELYYTQAREQSLLIAVNCVRPGGTCFCASWGNGPQVNQQMPYDLAMTEMRKGFVIRSKTKKGAAIIDSLSLREANDAEVELEGLMLQRAAEHMGRQLQTDDLPQLLDRAIDSPHWDHVAKRCLSCGNCTMVCPTCFCSTVSDSDDLATGSTTRTREWESCYTHQFSYTTSGPVRSSIRARYRHWLRHKLDTWHDQFGVSGCVGCGRCITWCPVGIDLTAEVESIRRYDAHDENHTPPRITVEARP